MILLLLACVGKPVATTEPAACPDSPNCVSTLADPADEQHFIEAIPYEGDEATARARAREALLAMPRMTVIEDRPGYLYVTQTSALWRFVDDLELWFADGRIALRSASRVGHGDMGVNRARVEALRTALQQ